MLVVEDQADIAAFLGAFFRASGLELSHINPRSTAEVLETVATESPACVLLDLGLAGFSGLDVLRELRASGPGVGDTPVIVLTADAREVTQKAAWAAGATDYMTKPFLVRDLFDRVEAFVST